MAVMGTNGGAFMSVDGTDEAEGGEREAGRRHAAAAPSLLPGRTGLPRQRPPRPRHAVRHRPVAARGRAGPDLLPEAGRAGVRPVRHVEHLGQHRQRPVRLGRLCPDRQRRLRRLALRLTGEPAPRPGDNRSVSENSEAPGTSPRAPRAAPRQGRGPNRSVSSARPGSTTTTATPCAASRVAVGSLAAAVAACLILRFAYEGLQIADTGSFVSVLVIADVRDLQRPRLPPHLGRLRQPAPTAHRPPSAASSIGFVGSLLAYFFRSLTEAPGEKLHREEYETAARAVQRSAAAPHRQPGGPREDQGQAPRARVDAQAEPARAHPDPHHDPMTCPRTPAPTPSTPPQPSTPPTGPPTRPPSSTPSRNSPAAP